MRSRFTEMFSRVSPGIYGMRARAGLNTMWPEFM